jgi:methionyl aminopeptidase
VAKPSIKTGKEIDACRASCRLAAETLLYIGPFLRPGLKTIEIDRLVHAYIVDHGAYPSPLNYHGFPKSVCTSINEVVCHGIPSEAEVLRDGDIINVDVTVLLDGFHGDTSATFYIGTPSPAARHLTEVARKCLDVGIAEVGPNKRLSGIGKVIEALATSQECSVVRDYVGHGIGRQFHEPPQVAHFRKRDRGADPRFETGWVFTIEPMINAGDWRVEVMSDGWTVRTRDRKLSAQFEHTLLVTETGVEILTDRGGQVLRNSEDVVDR